MLSKENRLKNSSSFKQAHRNGIHLKGKYGKMVVFDRKDENPPKFGVVVSADKGNAVQRNNAKRRIRHAFRKICDLCIGFDIFFVVWDVNFDFENIYQEIERLLKDAIRNHGSN